MKNGMKIYIPIWLDLLFEAITVYRSIVIHLHSNMVRFIMIISNDLLDNINEFTFQYG